jgi:hypothetical protein
VGAAGWEWGSVGQRGASAVLTDLAPGLLRIAASGTIAGKTLSVARAVEVQPGKVTVVEVSLSAGLTDPKSRDAGPEPASDVTVIHDRKTG